MKLLKKIALTGALSISTFASVYAEDLKMSTVAPGTSAYLTMSSMATLVNGAQDKHHMSVDATGAATKHMINLAKGDIDLAMTAPILVKLMRGQKAMYKKLDKAPELAKNLRLLYWFRWGPAHYITYAEDGMTSLDDLRDKKVYLGPPGGGARNSAHAWLKAQTGMVAGEDYKAYRGGWSEGFQAFQDRQVDAYVVGGLPPFPQMEQLTATSKMRLLGPNKAQIDAQTKEQKMPALIPGRSLDEIDVSVYGDGIDNKENIFTYGAWVGVITRADISEDTIYDITKAYWEAAKDARKTTPWLKDITPEVGIRDGGLALHAGAQRYYKEIGLEIPKGSQAQ